MSALAGAAELAEKLKSLDLLTQKKVVYKALRYAMKPCKEKAKEYIPIGTRFHKSYKGRVLAPGFAQSAVTMRAVKAEDGLAMSVGVKAEAFYATVFVELGTAKMSPHPWLSSAMNETADEQVERLMEHLKGALATVAAGGNP